MAKKPLDHDAAWPWVKEREREWVGPKIAVQSPWVVRKPKLAEKGVSFLLVTQEQICLGISVIVSGKKILWEAWPPCECGVEFRNTAAGVLSQLCSLQYEVDEEYYHGCTSVFSKIVWLEWEMGSSLEERERERERFLWTDKTTSNSISIVKILLTCLYNPTLPVYSQTCYHCPYFHYPVLGLPEHLLISFCLSSQPSSNNPYSTL